jgi:hypothetical protein
MRIPYRDFSEEKKEEIRRKRRERYAEQKASKMNSIRINDFDTSGGEQTTTSTARYSNNDVQYTDNIGVIEKASKRQRNTSVHIDIVEKDSCREVCILPGVKDCVINSETNSSSNNVSKSSNQLFIQQVLLQSFFYISYSTIILFFSSDILECIIQIGSICRSRGVEL